ncbi:MULTISPECIES: 3-hydroxyacyl-CoA dehydrogenase NAD-binding domain-containing protein [Nocardiopsis]|uniref:3-hydroxyacyl-CoA dehydrogenase NAD-binding protein n=1 Tax=Nocardiopsis dassonvillei (strain ATCC 23218 / DSM 43111 / CIP 107115 / JCM 7437 / KCTC 9190 / NBRC 14626 / NCTC 10488 / NRRL B-5397 / IMRU 509) TaxID=446468 RepID=D7AZX7_NOCDD|nr:3-hydroxyacyl-CoA dehydrogenase NAD-binding domain-containing protein [Nocardiopsis dassonvillei]ADH68248.1 3-hydroxyacyl-CoA dehydrogenase NAD-binding protein [Nocardiopsis dassonvillei subsp. dassonvillei DSM 43111]VEI88752.1 Fatty acid oxidation complex subunit alpha [Nocardiopsis dassonvillei]
MPIDQSHPSPATTLNGDASRHSPISELFSDEVVTNALSRDVELPYGAGTAVLITLDNGHDHTKPNTFGPGGLLSLDAAIEAARARTDIVAVAVTGKPFIFAVGADLTGVPALQNREQAHAIGKLGHDVFRKLGELDVPTFALVNGAAMGGGVEVALHCTYRTISSGVPALSLPETFLGLVPGWGGTYLLPNLIGAEKALKVIIDNPLAQNKVLKGTQAFEMGIADAMFEPADFVEESLRWAARVVKGDVVVERPEVDKGEAWDNAVNMARFTVEGKLHGAAPAPARAVELVAQAKTRTRDEGFAAEDDALADLIMSDELRAGLYAFDLVQKRAKRPAGAPDKSLARKVTKVGVVGAGLMAGQLALLFARRLDVPVVMTDLDQERLDRGVAYVHGEVDKLLRKGRVNNDKANHLKALVTGSLTKDAFSDADFVIEAVFEKMEVKQQVFAEVEAVVSPEAVLATNTSSLSITEMASKLRHPERVVGFHFFNPVAVLPLLEIVRGEATDEAALATAFATAKKLKKTAVLCKDAPAFVVNRLLTLFMGEVLGAVGEGTEPETADRAVAPLGLPMSPLLLLQLVGPAVALHVSETLHEAFPERFAVSAELAEIVKAGKTAIYAPDFSIDPEVRALLVGGDKPSEESEILDRALRALAREIRIMLDEGVVAEAADIDLCLITGAGWPFHTGGITPYLDRVGVSEAVNGKRFHEGDPKAF